MSVKPADGVVKTPAEGLPEDAPQELRRGAVPKSVSDWALTQANRARDAGKKAADLEAQLTTERTAREAAERRLAEQVRRPAERPAEAPPVDGAPKPQFRGIARKSRIKWDPWNDSVEALEAQLDARDAETATALWESYLSQRDVDQTEINNRIGVGVVMSAESAWLFKNTELTVPQVYELLNEARAYGYSPIKTYEARYGEQDRAKQLEADRAKIREEERERVRAETAAAGNGGQGSVPAPVLGGSHPVPRRRGDTRPANYSQATERAIAERGSAIFSR